MVIVAVAPWLRLGAPVMGRPHRSTSLAIVVGRSKKKKTGDGFTRYLVMRINMFRWAYISMRGTHKSTIDNGNKWGGVGWTSSGSLGFLSKGERER